MTFRMTVGTRELLELITAALDARHVRYSVAAIGWLGGDPAPEWYVYADGYPSPYERTLPVRPSPR